MARRIDCHHHVWRLDRGDYDWITEQDYPTLRRDFGADDLLPLLDQHDLRETVVVQAAETVDETHYMLEVAAENDFIKAVVGWVDIERGDAPDVLAALAQDPRFRGIRPGLMYSDDVSWILDDAPQRALAALTEFDLVFEALLWPGQLNTLHEALRRHPDLRCVINHFGYPDIGHGDIGPWRQSMAAIAADTNACVKFSGVLMGSGGNWPDSALQHASDHLLECFGPARLMWGSDWPHLLADSDYASWYQRSLRLLHGLDPSELDRIFGETAAAFYRI